STIEITIDELDPHIFSNRFVKVTGTISDTSRGLWVNGARAVLYTDNKWIASGVPVNQGGTATLHVRAVPSSDSTPPGSGDCLDNINSCNPNCDQSIDQCFDWDVPAFIAFEQHHGGYDSPSHYTGGDTACSFNDDTGSHGGCE